MGRGVKFLEATFTTILNLYTLGCVVRSIVNIVTGSLGYVIPRLYTHSRLSQLMVIVIIDVITMRSRALVDNETISGTSLQSVIRIGLQYSSQPEKY